MSMFDFLNEWGGKERGKGEGDEKKPARITIHYSDGTSKEYDGFSLVVEEADGFTSIGKWEIPMSKAERVAILLVMQAAEIFKRFEGGGLIRRR